MLPFVNHLNSILVGISIPRQVRKLSEVIDVYGTRENFIATFMRIKSQLLENLNITLTDGPLAKELRCCGLNFLFREY